MSRFKGSKPVLRGQGSQPAVGVLSPLRTPALTPSVTIPAPPPSKLPVQARTGMPGGIRQLEFDNPLRKLGLYLAIAFVFCRFSLLGELVSNSLNFDPHLVRILGIPAVVLAIITGGLGRVLRSSFPTPGWAS